MEAVKKRSMVINQGRVRLAEHARQEWVANAPEGAIPEDIEDPQFWSFMAMQFKPYDKIEVRADDETWMAECVVLANDRTWAKVKILNKYDLSKSTTSQQHTDKYEVAWKGPQRKWAVIRKSDQTYLKDELENRDIALSWMKEYEAKVA